MNYTLWVDTRHQCLHEIVTVCNTSRDELAVKTIKFVSAQAKDKSPVSKYVMNNEPEIDKVITISFCNFLRR
jgi:hypothetical protein